MCVRKCVYLNLARSREGCDVGWKLAIGFLDKINLFFMYVCVCFVGNVAVSV